MTQTPHAKPLLEDYLNAWAGNDPLRTAVADTVAALARATAEISGLVAQGPLAGDLAAARIDKGGGDAQKELDVITNSLIQRHLTSAPVAALASEEADVPEALTKGAPLIVAIDPLDGSSNIDTNTSIGTIFSVLPAPANVDPALSEAFLQPGRAQLAAGYAIYGPNTALVLTVGQGTAMFVLDPATRRYVLVFDRMEVPPDAREFAINMSNYRHWDEPIRLYIDDLLKGQDGPRDVDYNMRWLAAMVAEAHRILIRGGVYLYPSDARKGYISGRLRLIYEGNPIAFLMEQAGGAASNGSSPILDLKPTSLHQRVPLVFGSSEKVQRVARYVAAPESIAARSPLFAKRGLFRS
ncbi:class 1 fructose-bisphosphatase [Blastochloris viridis]|uniref:Fructose-1,6-bisphosphatase class 1 n=1 Tax=Blastochloris viridis TaxID=1079 RepID=A0A0H5B828_BLAVI|nr:class 1 fructose-bisphosphatase [Blastochloris viridis]ALK08381.1 Fructose-1,6-bisphosphatase class 1 [Blastochloris viridis]BAR98347.1 fructose-1,6-bisphosphatase [Blastochloris viridis]CUU41043.1 Fructose-1,6-bisphosphatase class 1 [Blastochloris viridis]